MAYRKNKQRVLSGGLNLLPPGDKAEPGSPLLLNFRPDQLGQLRTRRGMEAVHAFGSVVHTIMRHDGHRYVGAGSGLYNDGVSVATGFDGVSVGLVGYLDHLWVMNRSKQGKDDGTNFYNWLPAAPASAPAVAARDKTYVTISSFDDDETWDVVDPTGTTATFDHDASNAILGDSLHIACASIGTWQARRTYAADTDLGIADQNDEDEITIWLYASNPAAIDAFELTIDVNGGTFASDYYRCTIPGSRLTPTAFSWTAIQIKRKLTGESVLSSNPEYTTLLSQEREAREAGDELRAQGLAHQIALMREDILGRALGFTREGSTDGKDWSTAKAIRVEARVNEPCDVHFDQWEVGGDAVASISGTYRFAMTYDTDAGHESQPGPWSDEITVSGRGIDLSSIPVSGDAQVTSKHLYVQSASLGLSYRAATLSAAATTYTFAVLDEDLQNLGFSLERDHGLDHSDPPDARGLVGPYFGRLIAYSSAAHAGRLWWTPVGRPWYFPFADDEDGNWEDAGSDREEILKITMRPGTLVIYKEQSIWRLVGDPDTSSPQHVTSKIPPVGRFAIAEAGNVDYFVGQGGVYRFALDAPMEISQEIRPIFTNDYVKLHADVIIPPMDDSNRNKCVLEYANNELWLSYPTAGNSVPNMTLRCDLQSGRWYFHEIATGTGGFTALHNEGALRSLLGGTSSGHLWELESSSQDSGTPIPVEWCSAFQDCGLPDTPKIFADLVVDYQTAVEAETASTLTVSLIYDNGTTKTAIGSLSSLTRTRARFRLGTKGEGTRATNAAIYLDGTVSSQCVIYAVYLHWYAEARQALTFDTGPMDSGSEVAKTLDAFELDIETTGTVTWRIYSDLPGGAMAERTTATIANVAGRRIIRVFGLAVDGFRHRFTLEASAEFQLHGGRLRVLPIGEFVDGAAGESFATQEISYA